MLNVKVPEKHAAYCRATIGRMFLSDLMGVAFKKLDQDHFPAAGILLWAGY